MMTMSREVVIGSLVRCLKENALTRLFRCRRSRGPSTAVLLRPCRSKILAQDDKSETRPAILAQDDKEEGGSCCSLNVFQNFQRCEAAVRAHDAAAWVGSRS